MESHYNHDYNFSEVKEALLNKQAPFPPHLIYFFSDITAQELSDLEKVWPDVWIERRRGLLEEMENLAEADTILYFDDMAVMCLSDADPVARTTAIRLLWQSNQEKLVPTLLQMLKEDPEPIVRAAAATGLGNFVYLGEMEEISKSTYKTILEALIEAHLNSEHFMVRRRALEALGFASHPDIPHFIQKAYDTQDDEWLQSALFAMGRTCNQAWIDSILRMFNHPDDLVRYEAVRAAGELEAEGAREAIFDLLEEGTDDEDLYYAAIWSLTKIGGRGVRKLIEMDLSESEDPDEISFLEEALENLDFNEQIHRFDMMLLDKDIPADWDSDDLSNYLENYDEFED